MPVRHHYKSVPWALASFRGQIDLFSSFWLGAHWVWERRETAKKTGFPFSEESITDAVLLDLATQHPNEIHIVPFNKYREGKTGADWEWCFYDLDSRQYYPMLVQAKLLDDKDKQYSHLDRLIGSTGIRQIDRLMETSRRRQVPAVYVFYNNLSDPKRLPRSCKCFDCSECWGCSIALADSVRHNLDHRPKTGKHFDDVKYHSRPWACLLCQQFGSPSATAPESARHAMTAMYSDSQATFLEREISYVNAIPPPERTSKEPPSYFEPLMEILSADVDITEREFALSGIAAMHGDLGGVVLISDNSRRDAGS